MNNLMDHIDLVAVLITRFKELGLNENELAVILLIHRLSLSNQTLITAEDLALKMTLSSKDIDKILVDLIQKKFVEYDNSSGKLTTSIHPLKTRLLREFQKEILLAFDTDKVSQENATYESLYGHFEQAFRRNLTPLEINRLREWLRIGYLEEDILNALKEAQSRKSFTVGAIDKILLKRLTSKDVKKEGYSTVSEKWEKDIDETISIIQADWLDDE